MKRLSWRGWLVVAASLTIFGGAAAVLAQVGGPYDLSWSSVDSGGGHSDGGPYSLDGAVGQPDAGDTGSGGSYTLQGGVLAGQYPGSVTPTASVSPSPSPTTTATPPGSNRRYAPFAAKDGTD